MSGLVQQSSSIRLRKLACEEQTETCSASAAVERLKNAFRVLPAHTRPAVHDLQEGPAGGTQTPVTDLDRLIGKIARAVLECVLAQIPYDLPQLRRIGTHFHTRE